MGTIDFSCRSLTSAVDKHKMTTTVKICDRNIYQRRKQREQNSKHEKFFTLEKFNSQQRTLSDVDTKIARLIETTIRHLDTVAVKIVIAH